MILVTGGSSQGKREFVRQYLGEQDADGFVWTEGEKASWEAVSYTHLTLPTKA